MLPEALLGFSFFRASEEFQAEWDVLLRSASLLSMGEVFYHRLLTESASDTSHERALFSCFLSLADLRFTQIEVRPRKKFLLSFSLFRMLSGQS